MNPKGTLIIIGGNEDKGIETSEQNHLEFIEQSILAHVVRESGGTDANIVIIPTASRIPDQVAENYLEAFGSLGCKNLSVVDIRKRQDSDNPEYIELVKNAHCIMFSGGNQSKITQKIGGTALHQLLLERYKNEKLVIAGTSAGAMCMSNEMITGGGVKEFFNKGSVKMNEGLNLIPDLIIDSHFIRRGRFGRLAEAVARFPNLLGVGLAENTALVVKNCRTFQVIGSGMVILFDGSELEINDRNEREIGQEMTISNLKTHVLAQGYKFNIKKRSIKVVPMDSQMLSS